MTDRRRRNRGIGWLQVLAIAAVAIGSVAHAQDQKKVAFGAKAVILDNQIAIKDVQAESGKGKASSIASREDPKKFDVLYEAPKDDKSGTTDTVTVTYSDATPTKTIKVQLAAAGVPTPTAPAPTAAPANATPPANGVSPPELTSGEYQAAFKALFVLFVMALVLESGLATIFNWRPFLELFDSRGMKTIISVAFAWLFIAKFDFDIVTRLVNIYSTPIRNFEVNEAGLFITALAVAGGSSGVNKILIALGFRSVKTVEQIAPKPPPDKAWIAVRLVRRNAVGPVTVLVGPPGNPQVAGTIQGDSKGANLLRYFVRDPGRFPPSAGHSLVPGTSYVVHLEGVDGNGKRIGVPPADGLVENMWGPHSLAAGAIVDIELTL